MRDDESLIVNTIRLQDPAGLPVLERVPGGERGAVGAGLGGLLHVLPGLPRLRQHLRRLPHARIAGNVGECFLFAFCCGQCSFILISVIELNQIQPIL